MANRSEWFQNQLSTGGTGFAWAIGQVLADRQRREPPAGLGHWSAARHVFHMLFYEREMALPSMNLWQGRSFDAATAPDEDVAWDSQAPVSEMLAQFNQVRAEQVALAAAMPDAAWDETRATIWGPMTLQWVVTKTLQHTAEHTHQVLSLALFWEAALARHA
jgi:hypothetical protein